MSRLFKYVLCRNYAKKRKKNSNMQEKNEKRRKYATMLIEQPRGKELSKHRKQPKSKLIELKLARNF